MGHFGNKRGGHIGSKRKGETKNTNHAGFFKEQTVVQPNEPRKREYVTHVEDLEEVQTDDALCSKKRRFAIIYRIYISTSTVLCTLIRRVFQRQSRRS